MWLRRDASTAFAHRGCILSPTHRDRYSYICVTRTAAARLYSLSSLLDERLMPFFDLRIRQAESSDKIRRLGPSDSQIRFHPVRLCNNIGLQKKTDLFLRSRSKNRVSSHLLVSKRGGTGLMSYQTYQSVRYRHRRCTDTDTKSGTNVHTVTPCTVIHVVPNLPKCPVPVLMSYRIYRSVRYRY